MPLSLVELLAPAAAPQAVGDLRRYFGVDRPAGLPPEYTGGRFEALFGGGDGPGVADSITAADLIAVNLLSVRVPQEVALDLLEGPLGRALAEELQRVDPLTELGTSAAADLLADGGPVDRVWRLLEAPNGMGWVTAGKLLARKRPRLVPVYDGVVRCAVGEPDKAWLWFQAGFAEDDRALPRRLAHLREEAGVAVLVHPPRILDVLVWMRHRGSHRPSRCPRTEFVEIASHG